MNSNLGDAYGDKTSLVTAESASAGRETLCDIAHSDELHGSTVSLIDVDGKCTSSAAIQKVPWDRYS